MGGVCWIGEVGWFLGEGNFVGVLDFWSDVV